MRWIYLVVAAVILTGCTAKPYIPAQIIYNESLLHPVKGSTQVRVHRIQQITGSGLGEGCPLVLKVDDVAVVGLQQNQYVDLYLVKGGHDISVRFACALTEWRKSLTLVADGSYQEYMTELGMAGQYRMWRVK